MAFSITDANELIYNEHVPSHDDFDPYPLFTKKIHLDMYGRTWIIDIWTTTTFRKNASFHQSNMILFGGIFIDSLLFILFVLLSRANRRTLSFANKMTNSLIQRTTELEKASKAKSEFISNMSHELRTPLYSIIGYSELIIDDALKGENTQLLGEYGRNILFAGTHLKQIIDDLLDISIIESGEMKLHRHNIHLKNYIDSLNSLGQYLAKKNENSFEVINDLSEEEIFIDEKRLKQVILNLLGNASKFTKKGKISLIFERVANENLCIKVCDTGIGIAEKDLPKIFDRYVQVHDTKNDSVAGTGLGLALSKDLIHLMNGTLEVKSKVGHGTEFEIMIPSTTRQNFKKAA